MSKKSKKQTYTGYVGDCSDEQLQVLAQFRENVTAQGFTNPPYDDFALLRFLRARKFDLPKTMIMWNNFQAFREEYKVETELKNFVFHEDKQVRACYPQGYFRHDKSFRPIFIERTGQVKYDEMMSITTLDRIVRFNIQTFEHLFKVKFPALSELAGHRVQNTVYIMDLKGGIIMKILNNDTYKFLKTLINLSQDNYPEILGKMFIINAPFVFHATWNIIKHMIDEKTRKKIAILGSNYRSELLEIIDEENLPDFLGGKATVEEYGENLCKDEGPWWEYERKLKEKEAQNNKKPEEIEIDMKSGKEEAKTNDHKETKIKSMVYDVPQSQQELDAWEGEYEGDEMWEVPTVKHEQVSMGMMKSIAVRTMPTLETQQE